MSFSNELLAAPVVWLTPCKDGYCPVKIEARLGTQAADMM